MATVVSDSDIVVTVAQERILSDLGVVAHSPLATYCFAAIEWIVKGENKPTGAAVERVRVAVRAAVNVGLMQVYGDENSLDIPLGVRVRRDTFAHS